MVVAALPVVLAVVAGSRRDLSGGEARTASAVLRVASVSPALLQDGQRDQFEFMAYAHTQQTLIKSRMVLLRAVRRPEVARLRRFQNQEASVRWLQDSLKTDFNLGPELLRVSLTGKGSEELVVLLDAVVRAYMEKAVNAERNHQLVRLERLKEIQSKYEQNLRRKRKALRDMGLAAGFGDPSALTLRQRYLIEALALAEKEMLQVKVKLRMAQVEQNRLESREEDAAVPAVLVEAETRKDPDLGRLLARREEVDGKLARLVPTLRSGSDDPAVQPLLREKESLTAGIESRQAVLRPRITQGLRERSRKERDKALATEKQRIEYLGELEKALRAEVERLQKQAAAPNRHQFDFEVFQAEVSQGEKLLEQISLKIEVLEVELLAPSRVTLVEEAAIR